MVEGISRSWLVPATCWCLWRISRAQSHGPAPAQPPTCPLLTRPHSLQANLKYPPWPLLQSNSAKLCYLHTCQLYRPDIFQILLISDLLWLGRTRGRMGFPHTALLLSHVLSLIYLRSSIFKVDFPPLWLCKVPNTLLVLNK